MTQASQDLRTQTLDRVLNAVLAVGRTAGKARQSYVLCLMSEALRDDEVNAFVAAPDLGHAVPDGWALSESASAAAETT